MTCFPHTSLSLLRASLSFFFLTFQRNAFIYLQGLGKGKKALEKGNCKILVFGKSPARWQVLACPGWRFALAGGYFPGVRTGLPASLSRFPLGPRDWPSRLLSSQSARPLRQLLVLQDFIIAEDFLWGWLVPCTAWNSTVRARGVEGAVDQAVLQDSVVGRAGGEGRGRAYLRLPGLQLVVDGDVVSAALKAALAAVPPGRQGLRGLHADPAELLKQLAGRLLASGALQGELRGVHSPLAPGCGCSPPRVSEWRHWWGGHTCCPAHWCSGCISLRRSGQVQAYAWSSAAGGMQTHRRWPNFPPPIRNAWLLCRDHVGFLGGPSHEPRCFAVPGPLFDLRELVDQEDALSLGFATGFHDPGTRGAFPEPLHEQVVVGGQHVGDGDTVQVEVRPAFALLRQRAPFLRQLLLYLSMLFAIRSSRVSSCGSGNGWLFGHLRASGQSWR